MNGYGLILVVVLALGVTYWVVRRDGVRPVAPARSSLPSQLSLPMDVQDHVRTTAAHGHTDQAISFLRRRARLPASDAAAVVQALMTGRTFPIPHDDPPAPRRARRPDRHQGVDADLLTDLRAMALDLPAHREVAVRTLRQRTRMSDRAARRFLDGL